MLSNIEIRKPFYDDLSPVSALFFSVGNCFIYIRYALSLVLWGLADFALLLVLWLVFPVIIQHLVCCYYFSHAGGVLINQLLLPSLWA